MQIAYGILSANEPVGAVRQLVRALVEDARAGGFRIVPKCPYVGDWFDRHPEEADLRA